MRITLSPLAIQVLEVCAGRAVHSLPYSDKQQEETEKLKRLKFIYFMMDDDQPTYIATAAGERYLDNL